MKFVGILGIVLAISAIGYCIDCDQLQWDKEVDLYAALRFGDGRLFSIKSLDNTETCSLRTFYQLDTNAGLAIVTNSETKKLIHYLYSRNRDGNWQRVNLETGIVQSRRVYAFRVDKNGGGFACVYTCNENVTSRFDCFGTSLSFAKEIDDTIKSANLNLDMFQRWDTCNIAPGGCFQESLKSGYDIFNNNDFFNNNNI